MTGTEFQRTIIRLVESNRFKISDHGLDALLDDDLGRRDVVDSISNSEILENYPDFGKGPATLLFQVAADGRIVHCVWGIPKGESEPAVLTTTYIPNPDRWDSDLKVRR